MWNHLNVTNRDQNCCVNNIQGRNHNQYWQVVQMKSYVIPDIWISRTKDKEGSDVVEDM